MARDGDLDQLVDLLAADAVFYGDGAGKATAVRQPLFGRDRVAGFVVGLFKQAKRVGVKVEPGFVNGGPGFVAYDPEGKVNKRPLARGTRRCGPGGARA